MFWFATSTISPDSRANHIHKGPLAVFIFRNEWTPGAPPDRFSHNWRNVSALSGNKGPDNENPITCVMNETRPGLISPTLLCRWFHLSESWL